MHTSTELDPRRKAEARRAELYGDLPGDPGFEDRAFASWIDPTPTYIEMLFWVKQGRGKATPEDEALIKAYRHDRRLMRRYWFQRRGATKRLIQHGAPVQRVKKAGRAPRAQRRRARTCGTRAGPNDPDDDGPAGGRRPKPEPLAEQHRQMAVTG
jgi:hypothetical protein